MCLLRAMLIFLLRSIGLFAIALPSCLEVKSDSIIHLRRCVRQCVLARLSRGLVVRIEWLYGLYWIEWLIKTESPEDITGPDGVVIARIEFDNKWEK